MSSSSVWVQLYYEGKDEPKGNPIKIRPIPEDVADLAKAVKTELELDAPLNLIYVYPPGTTPPFSQDNAVDPGDVVPPGTTSKNPLIVVAPQLEPSSEHTLGPPHQYNDSLADTAVYKLLPFIEVLPDLLREVSLTRKIRLNPWERESARTTGSKRSDKFRKNVISYYRLISQSKKNVKCQILDKFTPIEEAQDKIIAAHIWKASTRGKGLEEFGLEETNVNSSRNGLFLTKGIEEAFDKQQVCFLYNILESKLVLWIADSNIMTKTIEGSTSKFSDVHQRPLICPANCLPYRRLLSWHARLTLERRKESIQVENFTSEYDNSPGRKASKDDPIAYAINSMVEPGDDASVGIEEP